MATFIQAVRNRQDRVGRLCVGLDPVLSDVAPTDATVVEFCRIIAEATGEFAAVFKPNIAFFEDRGPRGMDEYQEVLRAIRQVQPGVPVIGDWKRGDIGASNDGYWRAEAYYGIDAMTASPYFGQETWQKFLDYPDRGLILLCRTSNPGAREFQERVVEVSDDPVLGNDRVSLYQLVARNISRDWNTNGNCGLVVGATAPKEIGQVRQIAPNIFLLIPGVGTQGGDLEAAVANAFSPTAEADFVINASSSIIFAYKKGPFACEPIHFAQAAAAAAGDLAKKIRDAREALEEKAG